MGQSGLRKPRGTAAKPTHPSQRARRRRVAAEKLARKVRVLVCELDATARPSIGTVVRRLGYAVTAHHTLADTLREATTEAFDVIVTSLPTLSDEKARLLQVLRRATPGVPLVVVTSDGSLDMRRRCQGARPYYFTVRPLDEPELRTVLVAAARSTGQGN